MAFDLSVSDKHFRRRFHSHESILPLKILSFLRYYPLFHKTGEVSCFLECTILDGVHTEGDLHYYQFSSGFQILLSPYCPVTKSTVNKELFLEKIREKTSWFIGNDFNWKNVLLAGGSVLQALEIDPYEKQYEHSDFDLFVYGSNDKNKIRYLYDYFTKRFSGQLIVFTTDTDTRYAAHMLVITILIPNRPNIQIIASRSKSDSSILKSFDLSPCQVGFNGEKIVTTKEFIETITTRVARIKNKVSISRLAKYYQRGYHIYLAAYWKVQSHEREEIIPKIQKFLLKPDIGKKIIISEQEFSDEKKVSEVLSEHYKNLIIYHQFQVKHDQKVKHSYFQ